MILYKGEYLDPYNGQNDVTENIGFMVSDDVDPVLYCGVAYDR